MKVCNVCFCKIEKGEVYVATYGNVKPHVDLQLCSWQCLVKWVEEHRSELGAVKALHWQKEA